MNEDEWNVFNTLVATCRDLRVTDLLRAHYGAGYGNPAPEKLMAEQLAMAEATLGKLRAAGLGPREEVAVG
jgi:hypothetical protein